MVRGEPRQEAGGGLADALAQAVRGRLELAFLHFARDRPLLGQGGGSARKVAHFGSWPSMAR